MTDAAQRRSFAARLGHDFARAELLEQALTHSSIANRARPANERLEFLGDRVLNLVIADALMEQDGEADEGTLARRLNALVRKEACAEVAEALDLGQVLILGRAEARSGGRRKMALLGDAMEAVIAAVYLDAGFDAARRVILRHWKELIARAETVRRDPKTLLQEWAQARSMTLPRYEDLDRTGPDHAPVFTVSVVLENGMRAEGRAPSKQKAQAEAAAQLLARLEALDE
ncbi:MAG: ribonuclease III [Rubricella sp.]